MKILLCNERFLFRFGVDRLLIMLGRGLKAKGHSVSVMANRFDEDAVLAFASEATLVPDIEGRYLDLNELTAEWLEAEWQRLFPSGPPDLVVIGGWPFFHAIPVFRKHGCTVIFIDCGAVPLDGFEGGALITQQKVRQLRRTFIGEADAIASISDFIKTSQSIPDSQNRTATSILLGVSHIEEGIWESGKVGDTSGNGELDRVRKLVSQGWKVLLNLGRWEPGCYKNSEAIIPIVRSLLEREKKLVVLVLADPGIAIPEDLKEHILPLGFPSDQVLKELTLLSHLGLSVSLWEGFNLPLGEMQWLNRPVLVFDVGAHPEVVVHPWFLCHDSAEMTQKALTVLRGGGPEARELEQARRKFRSNFTWERVVDQYETFFIGQVLKRQGSFNVIIDATNACHDPANSGVIRVTRRVSREMQEFLNPVFVTWDDSRSAYVLPNQDEYRQLGQFNGPRQHLSMPMSPPESRILLTEVLGGLEADRTWLFITETLLEERGKLIRAFARAQGIALAAIFYDAIPILRPEFCKDAIIRENHHAYMRGLAQCDLVIPISEFSGRCLLDFWKNEDCKPVASHPVLIAGDFPPSPPPSNDSTGKVRILCVSTLEPRKNHKGLLAAVDRMQQLHPELDWTLTLVGNRYAGAPEIPELVERACQSNPRIRWLGIADDETLIRLYQEATFTVYPSMIEGFGLPIIESLFYGKPCLTHKEGVMAELAADGGCLTTDVLDVDALAGAIYRLSTDGPFREKLAAEATERPLKSWRTYSAQVLELFLRTHPGKVRQNGDQRQPAWLPTLFPRFSPTLLSRAEPLATLVFTSILARLRPVIALSISRGPNLETELCSRYSDLVVHYKTDQGTGPAVRSSNVKTVSGEFRESVVRTLVELDEDGRSLDLIYHDGTGTEEEFLFFLDLLLRQTPRAPMFVLLHHLRGSPTERVLAQWDWRKSPFIRNVERGFVASGTEKDLSLVFLSPLTTRGG